MNYCYNAGSYLPFKEEAASTSGKQDEGREEDSPSVGRCISQASSFITRRELEVAADVAKLPI